MITQFKIFEKISDDFKIGDIVYSLETKYDYGGFWVKEDTPYEILDIVSYGKGFKLKDIKSNREVFYPFPKDMFISSEIWDLKNKSQKYNITKFIEDISLIKILNDAPKMGWKFKRREYIVKNIKNLLLNKYISFKTSQYNGAYSTLIINGYLDEVLYDISDDEVYFRMKGNIIFHKVDIEDGVRINKLKTNSDKYNL